MKADDLIPLNIAHKILATFGITRPTRAYERWVKEDGFNLRDFSDVLFESPYVFVIDWKAWLGEELETISKVVESLGEPLRVELDEDGDSGFVICDDRRKAVKYRTSDADNFNNVIQAVQSVVSSKIEFRADPDNHDGDTFNYSVLPREEWDELESVAKPIIRYFFVPLA
jgi:hypothetical protein